MASLNAVSIGIIICDDAAQYHVVGCVLNLEADWLTYHVKVFILCIRNMRHK